MTTDLVLAGVTRHHLVGKPVPASWTGEGTHLSLCGLVSGVPIAATDDMPPMCLRCEAFDLAPGSEDWLGRPRRDATTRGDVFEVPWEVFAPRTPEQRYRLYVVAGRDDLLLLATAPDPGGIGQAMATLDADLAQSGRGLPDLGRVGVLDCLPEHGGPRGRWIAKPWDRGEKPLTFGPEALPIR